jgi:hypothetical protein
VPTYLLLGVSLINALIIITLLFEAAPNNTSDIGVALLLSETLRVACFHEVVRLRSGTTRRRHRSSVEQKSERFDN